MACLRAFCKGGLCQFADCPRARVGSTNDLLPTKRQRPQRMPTNLLVGIRPGRVVHTHYLALFGLAPLLYELAIFILPPITYIISVQSCEFCTIESINAITSITIAVVRVKLRPLLNYSLRHPNEFAGVDVLCLRVDCHVKSVRKMFETICAQSITSSGDLVTLKLPFGPHPILMPSVPNLRITSQVS